MIVRSRLDLDVFVFRGVPCLVTTIMRLGSPRFPAGSWFIVVEQHHSSCLVVSSTGEAFLAMNHDFATSHHFEKIA